MLGQCICTGPGAEFPGGGKDFGALEWPEELRVLHPRPNDDRGLVTYSADLSLPLIGPPLRSGEVWYLGPEDGKSLVQSVLLLHANGIRIRPTDGRPPISVAWSPFSLVQACRLHSVQADESLPWLRLFKVSVFHHGSTHIFATQGEAADRERAHWLADVSRALRVVTQSLFPTFALRTMPLPGAGWTATRLLAGYLLLCDDRGVSLVYAELHSHFDGTAMFAGYEDEYCDCLVLRLSIDLQTCVTERVGVDCSCFSLAGRHLTARTCAEKTLWLRAVSNVKVKLRHCAENPTSTELMHYRSAVLEHAKRVEVVEEEFTKAPLLPRRPQRSGPPPKPPVPGNACSGTMVQPLPRFPAAACIGGPSRLQQLVPPQRPPTLEDGMQEAASDDPPPAPMVMEVPVISTGRLKAFPTVAAHGIDLPDEPDEVTMPDACTAPSFSQAIRSPFPQSGGMMAMMQGQSPGMAMGSPGLSMKPRQEMSKAPGSPISPNGTLSRLHIGGLEAEDCEVDERSGAQCEDTFHLDPDTYPITPVRSRAADESAPAASPAAAPAVTPAAASVGNLSAAPALRQPSVEYTPAAASVGNLSAAAVMSGNLLELVREPVGDLADASVAEDVVDQPCDVEQTTWLDKPAVSSDPGSGSGGPGSKRAALDVISVEHEKPLVLPVSSGGSPKLGKTGVGGDKFKNVPKHDYDPHRCWLPVAAQVSISSRQSSRATIDGGNAPETEWTEVAEEVETGDAIKALPHERTGQGSVGDVGEAPACEDEGGEAAMDSSIAVDAVRSGEADEALIRDRTAVLGNDAKMFREGSRRLSHCEETRV